MLLQQVAVGAVLVVTGLLTAVLFLPPPVWVYRDAKTHSTDSARLWALVAFLAPLVGFALYLSNGREKRPARR